MATSAKSSSRRSPSRRSLAERALALLCKRHQLEDPLLVDHAEAVRPSTGKTVHRFAAVTASDANGPVYRVFTNSSGRRLRSTAELEALFDPADLPGIPVEPVLPVPSPAITIDPTQNVLTLAEGDTFKETLTVTVPKDAAAPKADVYFLADTTASMSGILSAVQGGANNILTALSGLGVDLAFGVGNYKDFPNDPYAFQHQLSPTAVAATVTAQINGWAAAGGFDGPEGQLFALDRLATPPAGPIGWRAGAKRIIVWFGDVPGHDPVCPAISGEPAPITEASVTAKLVSENITVLAISTANPGLDGDPQAGAADYTAACGPPGGSPGQGTRFAAATGGAFVTGINPGNVVNTIVSLVSAAVSSINNLSLVPSGATAPFVGSISPAAGYGPLAGDETHTLTFEVEFVGAVPCTDEPQSFDGTLDVVADGVVVAAKKVHVTVPPCSFGYSVKFVCGEQPDCPCECSPVRPGRYATEINIHNTSGREVKIRKRVVPVVLAGAAVGREPAASKARAGDSVLLPPHSATMDDCCRLSELLFGAKGSPALNIGFLEITASAEVAVTAVYTASGLHAGGISIDVQQIRGRRQ